jgi:cytochrome c-type biogenesis protein CcmH
MGGGGMKRLILALCLLVAAAPALAVEPDEILKDPALESRARALSAQLRCMVCQNQSIDDSEAPLARDLRLLIREHLVKGETDPQIMDYIVVRYGDFVLLKPRFTARTIVLWLTPFVVLLVAIAALLRRRNGLVAATEKPLSGEEQAALKKALE